MGGYFTGILWVRGTRPREPSTQKYFHASDHSHGSIFAGTVHRDKLQGRITSLLLYILVPVPVKYPPMELRNCTHGDGGGDECPSPPYPWNTRPWNWGGKRCVRGLLGGGCKEGLYIYISPYIDYIQISLDEGQTESLNWGGEICDGWQFFSDDLSNHYHLVIYKSPTHYFYGFF